MSVDPEKLSVLTAQMRQLGLPDAERLARAELETGRPILATESFLKWLTSAMVSPEDFTWIDRAIGNPKDYPVLGSALQRLLEAGVDRNDLNAVVRSMQFRICDHICFMLDQVALEGYVPIQDFGVYHVGGGDWPTTDKPIARLDALHEQIGPWDPDHPEGYSPRTPEGT